MKEKKKRSKVKKKGRRRRRGTYHRSVDRTWATKQRESQLLAEICVVAALWKHYLLRPPVKMMMNCDSKQAKRNICGGQAQRHQWECQGKDLRHIRHPPWPAGDNLLCKQLKANCTLSDYNIWKESMLYWVLCLWCRMLTFVTGKTITFEAESVTPLGKPRKQEDGHSFLTTISRKSPLCACSWPWEEVS